MDITMILVAIWWAYILSDAKPVTDSTRTSIILLPSGSGREALRTKSLPPTLPQANMEPA